MVSGNASWSPSSPPRRSRKQRRARLWGIFFKLLTFAYVLAHPADGDRLEGRRRHRGKKHTAMVEVNGIIAPEATRAPSAVNGALQAAFKDKNTQGVVVRINSPAAARCRRRPSTTR
jgi:protease-4